MKFLKKIWIFGLLLCFFSCGHEEVEKAPAPLSLEKTAKVFTDFVLADASTSVAIPTTKDSLQILYYQQILEMHQTNLAEYEQSLLFYTSDDSLMVYMLNAADSLLKK